MASPWNGDGTSGAPRHRAGHRPVSPAPTFWTKMSPCPVTPRRLSKAARQWRTMAHSILLGEVAARGVTMLDVACRQGRPRHRRRPTSPAASGSVAASAWCQHNVGNVSGARHPPGKSGISSLPGAESVCCTARLTAPESRAGTGRGQQNPALKTRKRPRRTAFKTFSMRDRVGARKSRRARRTLSHHRSIWQPQNGAEGLRPVTGPLSRGAERMNDDDSGSPAGRPHHGNSHEIGPIVCPELRDPAVRRRLQNRLQEAGPNPTVVSPTATRMTAEVGPRLDADDTARTGAILPTFGTARNNCSGQFRRSPARRSQAKSAPLRPRFLTVMGSLAGNSPPAAAQARFIASNGGW